MIIVCTFVFLVPLHFGVYFGYIERDKAETAKLIEQFHTRMNTGQFDLIYDDASLYLRRSATRETLTGAMRKAKDDYGAFERVQSSQISVVKESDIEIRAVYNSSFEKGDATEWFIFSIEGRNLRLRFYDVQRVHFPSPKAISLEYQTFS